MNIMFKNIVLTLLLGLSVTVNATSSAVVGWIDDFEGEPNNYSLIRGSQPLPVEFFTPLQNGDKVRALHAQHRIILKFGDKTRVEVTQKNSPHIVKAIGKVPSKFDHLLTWVGESITSWYRKEKEVEERISTHTKGDAYSDVLPDIKLLTVPKRSDKKMQVTVGMKPLYLAWAGGTPPYNLEIKRHKKTLVSLKGLSTRRIHSLKCLLLQRGDYRVILRDAKQKQLAYTFTVVANKPPYPPELQNANLPDLTRLTLQAAWLAAQEKGIWAFEAYQSVAPIAQYYQPARILRDTLEKGERIVEPK
jgi:hypothetical protein